MLKAKTVPRCLFAGRPLALPLLTMMLLILGCSGDPSQSSRTSSDNCQPPSPLPFELVLWHEGFSSGSGISVAELNEYLGTILAFAEAQEVKTVFITAPAFPPNDPEDVTTALKSFVDTLADKGIGIGIQFGSNGDITDPSWFDYTSVNTIVGNHAYVLGLDSENYTNGGTSTKASNTMELVNFFTTQISNAGASAPEKIIVAGTAGYNPADNWAAPLVNFYEYYSSPAALNGVLASNVDKPGTAFDSCVDQKLLKNPTAPGGGIGGGEVPGWPAFSFEQTGTDCLAGSIQPAGICGSFDIFGQWSFDCVLQYMTLFKNRYYGTSETPTFVLYQSDYLPCAWLANGCPSS